MLHIQDTEPRLSHQPGQGEARSKVTYSSLCVMLGKTFTQQSGPIIFIQTMLCLAFHLQPIVNENSISYLNDNGEGVVAINHLTVMFKWLLGTLSCFSHRPISFYHCIILLHTDQSKVENKNSWLIRNFTDFVFDVSMKYHFGNMCF